MCKKLFLITLLLATLFLQTACGPKESAGGTIGAGAGAVTGAVIFNDNPVLGALLGGALGGWLGSSIGRGLDAKDREYMNQGTISALNHNISYEWYNPDTGHHGVIRPTSTSYNNRRQQYCREFTQEVFIGDHSKEAYGTACLQPDGSWKII